MPISNNVTTPSSAQYNPYVLIQPQHYATPKPLLNRLVLRSVAAPEALIQAVAHLHSAVADLLDLPLTAQLSVPEQAQERPRKARLRALSQIVVPDLDVRFMVDEAS